MATPTSTSQPNPSNQTTAKQRSWNVNLSSGGRQPFSGGSSQSNQPSIAIKLLIFLIILL